MEIILLQATDSISIGTYFSGNIGEYWKIISLLSAAIGGLITWGLTNRKTNAEIQKTLLEISDLKISQIEKLGEKRANFESVKKKVKEIIIELLSCYDKSNSEATKQKRNELIEVLRKDYVNSISDYIKIYLIFNERSKTLKKKLVEDIISNLESIHRNQKFINNIHILSLIKKEEFLFDEIELMPLKDYIFDLTQFWNSAKRKKTQNLIKEMIKEKPTYKKILTPP